jgi:hypothetical protein
MADIGVFYFWSIPRGGFEPVALELNCWDFEVSAHASCDRHGFVAFGAGDPGRILLAPALQEFIVVADSDFELGISFLAPFSPTAAPGSSNFGMDVVSSSKFSLVLNLEIDEVECQGFV